MKKPILLLIQSTDSPVDNHIGKGIWDRQRFSLAQYATEFDVLYYTSDNVNRQDIMPPGVTHKTASLAMQAFGLRHILYYIFLILSSLKWRKYKNSCMRIIGVNVPVVPIIKALSGKHVVVSYQFDWAMGMKKDYKGIKPMVSGFVQSGVIGAADHLICTTRWLQDIAVERYHFNRENTTIIPNYVNIEVFRPDAVKKKQIVFAGRLHWSKGIDTLIKAFDQFSKSYPDYKLIIMGQGEDGEKLKKMSTNPGILFTGSVSNMQVATYFNESEIFVLPTVNMEGHPKALVEAMAAGCKCVTSDVPGNNNVLIESNSQDLLFPSQNAEVLCQVLIRAVGMNDRKQYEFAVINYSSTVCFEKELKILKNII